MRLPSETKQQLFLKSFFRENSLLYSGLGVFLAVLGTVNTDQAFFLGSVVLLLILVNSFLSSLLSDIFRIRLSRWAQVLITSLLLSILASLLEARIQRLPETTPLALLLLSASPLAYARSQALAAGTTPGRAIFDAAGAGLGIVAALLLISLVREVFGLGHLGGLAIFQAPPLPLLTRTVGGFLATAVAVVLFRLVARGDDR